jgi:signal transduction histidine kinase
VFAAVVVLTVAAAGLAALNGPAGAWLNGWWVSAPAALALACPALLLALRTPRQPVAWVLLGGALCFAVDAVAGEYATWATVVRPGAPLVPAVVLAGRLAGVLDAFMIPWLLMIFPDGRAPSAGWRGWRGQLMVLGAVMAAAGVVGAGVPLSAMDREYDMGAPAPLLDAVRGWSLPVSDELGVRLLGLLGLVLPLVLLTVVVAAWRYRSAGPELRAQLRWFLPAGAVYVVASTAQVPGLLGTVVLTGSALALSGAVTAAVVRYRLFDIDVVLNRTALYLALSAAAVGAYVALVAGLSSVLPAQARGAVAAAVVAVAVAPVRTRLQRGIDRLMRGQRSDPYAMVSTLAERLEQSDDLMAEVVGTVARAFRSPYVRMEVTQPAGLASVVECGTPRPGTVFPLSYRGVDVGSLLVAPSPGDRPGARDRRLLADLVRQAGVAAHAVGRTEDLQRGRERLVAAREEERRRLRRDLHDGLGPVLGGLTLKLDTVRRLLRTDPDRAEEVLRGAKADVAGAMQDVRRLVHDLRPPALDELGLAGALAQQAARFQRGGSDGLAVEVDVAELGPLAAAVEVAVYRVVSEALTNVARHAHAARARVVVRRDGADLLVEVEDDGLGLRAGSPLGVGMLSMEERSTELGGTFSVGAARGGGTLVRARLPLRASDPVSEPTATHAVMTDGQARA